MDADGFKKVSYKGKKSKNKGERKGKILRDTFTSLGSSFDEESSLRKICEAKLELLSTDLFSSLVSSLKEGLLAVNKSDISNIICLGLGKIGECVISRYQFALILCLKEILNGTVSIYDPIFAENDVKLLNHFKVTILNENLEGKYKIQEGKQVLFFLPHCPKQLTNNLLWANWGQNLSSCIVIANSFSTIIENCSSRTLKGSAGYILKIAPYVLELAVVNNFKFCDIFNDLAIHVFPQLNVPQEVWSECSEPTYIDEDIEFITKEFRKV